MSLDEWLEEVAVDSLDVIDPQFGLPESWFGVSVGSEGGCIAYFRDEQDAFRFRLDYINRKLNP